VTFSLQRRWSRAAMGVARGRPTAGACSASVQEEQGGGRVG
jgi:hypothetical protein